MKRILLLLNLVLSLFIVGCQTTDNNDEDLTNTRQEAIHELSNYVNANDYTANNYESVIAIITNATIEINAAEVIVDIRIIVSNSKNEIDLIPKLIEQNPDPIEKHLILNKNGDYGGSYDVEKYGEGAPLNGEYDNPESPYYLQNDFYNMQSTKERTIFTNFRPYQQTMEDTSGIASALMILNHLGEDVENTYSEIELVKKYEELNNTEIYGNGTDANGLKNLFNDIGYTALAGGYIHKGSNRAEQVATFNEWVMNHLNNGRFIMLRYQDNIDFEWNVVIGLDLMGTPEDKLNKVLIMATPNDNADHYQDGYTLSASGRVFRWWQNVQESGHFTDQYDCLVVYPKTARTIVRFNDNTDIVQTIPEIQLIRNADGNYGGTTDAAKYGGGGRPVNGADDVLHSPYFAFVDYFNMTNSDTRYIINNFRAYLQTMASSCGISSTLAVLNHYGEDVREYNEVFLVENAERINDTVIYNRGIGYSGLRNLVNFLGYDNANGASYSRDRYVDKSSMNFSSYPVFLNWVKNHISKGIPIPVSWRPHSGHWQVIIGIDDMGTDYIYDDVIILSDSSDSWDHYQDGYNTLPATLFYNQWYNGSYTFNQQYVIIHPKN